MASSNEKRAKVKMILVMMTVAVEFYLCNEVLILSQSINIRYWISFVTVASGSELRREAQP